jgi:NAD(P)-dependent dehydrogenase (short-subunit alcohol dehydrogenase family)
MKPPLDGRVAIVTGGAAGIGLACAEALAEAGARVAVGTRRGAPGPQGTMAAALDVRDAASVGAFFAAVEAALGPTEILVNAAGVSLAQHVDGHDEAAWRDVMATNLDGPFRMIRAALPGMKARGRGVIVNIASTAARAAEPDYAAYCASKAGLVGLTRAVALEGAPHGVRCVAVSPTWVETDMLRASAAELAEISRRTVEEEVEAIAARSPQKRLVQPAEVGALVAFLAGDAARGLTMEDIQINAGAIW